MHTHTHYRNPTHAQRVNQACHQCGVYKTEWSNSKLETDCALMYDYDSIFHSPNAYTLAIPSSSPWIQSGPLTTSAPGNIPLDSCLLAPALGETLTL